ncbi:unnamed protein product [Lupinus luteus]|uniref:Uncharacterized protein n=1 Tax=Lupinus luteus TaxID=3873 RepID=A0AAV1VS18_LUPLU
MSHLICLDITIPLKIIKGFSNLFFRDLHERFFDVVTQLGGGNIFQLWKGMELLHFHLVKTYKYMEGDKKRDN